MNKRYLKNKKTQEALLRIIVSNTEKAVLQKITNDIKNARRINPLV